MGAAWARYAMCESAFSVWLALAALVLSASLANEAGGSDISEGLMQARSSSQVINIAQDICVIILSKTCRRCVPST